MKKFRIVPDKQDHESMSEWAKEIAEMVKRDRKAAKEKKAKSRTDEGFNKYVNRK